jgi:hypothetical protein
MASAEIGVNIGVSGQLGTMEGSGKQNMAAGTQTSETRETIFGTASMFLEKELTFLPGPLKRLSIGYEIDNTPTRKIGSSTNVQIGNLGDEAGVNLFVNEVSAEVSGFDTLYVTLNLTDWLYLKSGKTDLDIKTTETLESGGVYGNASIDGTVLGIGTHFARDDGLFFRAEYNQYDFDGVSIASSEADSNSITTLNGLDGEAFKFSLGKAF